ncbi:MAG: hypothetical protein ACR2RV_17275, partial [Verrucomicrobiales bacterium]
MSSRPTYLSESPLPPSESSGGSALALNPTSRSSRRSPVVDTLAIAAILAAVNYVISRTDPFWLEANPTPFLLLPLLIGGRYGSAAGVLVGILTTASVLGGMYALGVPPGTLVETNALALVCFPITGLLCGEIYNYFKSRDRHLSERCNELEANYRRTCANLELHADSNTALQRRLAVHGVRLTSLDSELRRLLAPSTNDLHTDALALLNRLTDITEAAIYTVDKRELKRMALLGNGDELPENLRSDHVEIIDQAIAEKQMVTCRELWGDTPQLFSRHLAAIPWIGPDGEVSAILLVRRLPFHCVTWQHFAQIETICTWISQYAPLREDPRAQAGAVDYEQTVALCIDTYQRHAVPSSAVRFLASGDRPLTQKKLRDAITPLLRPTDLATSFDLERPNLAVLLPMGGRSEAERLVEQVSSDSGIELE